MWPTGSWRWRRDERRLVLRLVAAARGGGGLLGDAPRRPAVGRAAADGERSRPALRLRDAHRRLRPARARATSTGLAAAAVVHTYPSPGAQNVEINKAVYAELAAPDLPWRHTVDLPQGKALRPWIVLLVGTADEIEVAGDTVRLQPSVLDAHPLGGSARGAHVEQEQAGRPIARLISRARAHARPRPRRGDRPGVHRGRDAGVADPGRRDGRARALPPLALPHEIRRRLRRARPAAEAPPGGEPRRCRCHLRPAAGGDDARSAARSSPSRHRRPDRCRRRHGTTSRRSPSSSATPPIRSSGSPTTPGRGRLRLLFR